MTTDATSSCLELLGLNAAQRAAATARDDRVVTAGAGAGKTRTLVGRYLALLETGAPLRAIAAITFTDKAAREMRTRIRQTIAERLDQPPPTGAPVDWEGVFADLDAARIGTIHGLCAQVLREHLVEAAQRGIMPGFTVLEEGRATQLRVQAVEEALAWATEDEDASPLFGVLGEGGLRHAALTLLERRLDADAAFARLGADPLAVWSAALDAWLATVLDDARWRDPLAALADLHAHDPGDKMELARREVLAYAAEADAARRARDFDALLAALAALRKATTLTGRKGNWPDGALEWAKAAMRELRGYFDARLSPLADSKKTIAWAQDVQAAQAIPRLRAVYGRAAALYDRARRAENALDFDDLEAGAAELLDLPVVRAAWQANLRAVLVDEFQDTNERQRRIIYALTGFDPARPAARAAGEGQDGMAQAAAGGAAANAGGRLWIVGDAKQSIYRFRGADVTVFQRVEDDIVAAGGRTSTLDLTFRGHDALLATTNRLLEPILNEAVGPDRPYAVPFAPLAAHRREPRPGIAAPFVELHLGLGDSAEAGRQAAVDGLAARLHALRDQEGVSWQDIALLFRASSAFTVYEDALERAGIPFVTVAGRGFYDRPEIRTLLNALLALADPRDDLAMAGFLRSPFVGVSDASLYLMRFPPRAVMTRDIERPCALWPILNHPALPEIVLPDDLPRARAGRELLIDLTAVAGRAPVATLLKRLLDHTHYRAQLHATAGDSRTQRNVDKLLADAHASGLVSVREFVKYVHSLRDVGARESEAPTEAGRAVQLMTVHRAKGLEFPVVVIADAAHAGRRAMPQIRLDDRLGVTVNLSDRDDANRRPVAYWLAAERDAARDDAEERRLLYVAATRAREKLLISGHVKLLKEGKLSAAGWLAWLGQVIGLDEFTLAEWPTSVVTPALPAFPDVACRLYPAAVEPPVQPGQPRALGEADANLSAPADDLTEAGLPAPTEDLVAPLIAPPPSDLDAKLRERMAQPPRRVWWVAPRTARAGAPAWVVGALVHIALRHWYFTAEGLDAFLRPFALEMGVVDAAQIRAASAEAARVLRRLRAHPLWAELDAAPRWHELPFSAMEGGQMVHGVIDLVYRAGDAWRIVEFKTDELRPGADLGLHIKAKGYDAQMQRYVHALRQQSGVEAEALFVFLNVGGQVVVVRVPRG